MVALLSGLLGPRSTFSKKLESILGFRPGNEFLYEVALRHSSMPETERFSDEMGNRNNQRLEFLGDAFLGSICAEILYRHFPEKDEGFLSSMRSKMVNRKHLNHIAKELELPELLSVNSAGMKTPPRSIYGDALEALIGAVFLDKGYKTCDTFVRQKIVSPYVNLNTLSEEVISYKSLLFEWAQKNRKKLVFSLVHEERKRNAPKFDVIVILDEKQMARGSGASKKHAEENASEKVCKVLKLTRRDGRKNATVGRGRN
ncbi:MAG: ribonuclease III [Cryomorphaceae bacterium]|nr:ribonuclease III [Cryomorphaceae bacterium]